MTRASDNVFPRLLISEGGSTSTPAAARVTVYAKSDGLLYSKDDAGTETPLGGGGGGGDITTDVAWAALGDLIVGTGPDHAAVLTAGADGRVLTAAVAEATGLKWAAPAAGGLAHSYIGYNTVGGSTQAIAATTAVCKKVVLASAGLLGTIDFYVAQAADAVYQTIIAGVWADDSDKAGTIIFSSGGTAGAYYGGPVATYPARWFAAPCGLYLPVGTYWIGMATGPACLVYYDTSGTDRTWDISANTQAVDGARWTQTDTTRKYSIRGSFWS